jgi:rhodanese-related sulfurtransferase
MPIQQTTPDKAKEALDKDDNAIYLDVRSSIEFKHEHPTGAINIPIMEKKAESGMMEPNHDFAKVVQEQLPKDKVLYVGCMRGGRSQRSCEILASLGYTNLFNVDGGVAGNDHQKGWKALGLPMSRG